mgnify:FL=1
MLKIQDLTIQYGTQPPVVSGFQLSMKKGEIVSIVGESGSGKTTVIRAVLGALPGAGHIAGGDILFHGQSLRDKTPEDWRKIRGSQISMIFQDCGGTLNPIRKIGSQFVEYLRTHKPSGKKEAWQKACDLLHKMRLPDSQNIMNSYPHQLSGGMRQRVGIAMAIAFNPALLLADDPPAHLTLPHRRKLCVKCLLCGIRLAQALSLSPITLALPLIWQTNWLSCSMAKR